MHGLFDDGLKVFLKYVPEDEIDSVLFDWYAQCCAEYGHYFKPDQSDYYDLLRPVLVQKGFIDDATGADVFGSNEVGPINIDFSERRKV